MKIAIIGAGLTGLSSAYYLSKENQQVTIYEKNNYLGGLAGGFKKENWQWNLEKYYHHFFNNDNSVKKLIGDLKTDSKLFFSKPITSIYFNQEINRFDNPYSLLSFPFLSIIEKIRTSLILAYLKLIPSDASLKNQTAEKFLSKTMGKKAYQVLWQPLFIGKFGRFAGKISASWFWARIKKRTNSLGYYQGGIQQLIDDLVNKLNQKNIKILLNTKVNTVRRFNNHFIINSNEYDALIIAVPTPVFLRIIPFLPNDYYQQLSLITHLSALSLILVTDKPILKKTYWLNINDNTIPFVSLVQHTNFIDKKYYGNNHIAYLGTYLPANHPFLTKSKEELLKNFLPYVNQIIHNTKYIIHNTYLFTDDYAQTVVTPDYALIKPTMETPIKNLYLGNIDVVYPWDRGVNYAIELGQKIAEIITTSKVTG